MKHGISPVCLIIVLMVPVVPGTSLYCVQKQEIVMSKSDISLLPDIVA